MLHEFASFAAVVINESIDNCMVERFKHYLQPFFTARYLIPTFLFRN